MNKFYFLISAIVTSTFAYAQQPNNADFESWENLESDTEEPTNWSGMMTGDLCTFCAFGASQRVSREETDVHGGNYSVLIESTDVFTGDIVNGAITTGRVTAPSTTPSAGYNQTLTGNPSFNHPFTHEPDSLVFWAKYNITDGSDSARVSFVLHDDYNLKDPQDGDSEGHVVASARANFQTGNTWERISIPFDYSGASIEPVDYLLATFTSSYAPGLGNVNAKLYVDDLEFIYPTVTSIDEVVADVFVYPNPSFDGKFDVNLTGINGNVELVVYDMFGRVIHSQHEMVGRISNLNLKANSGIYLLTVNSELGTKVIKLMKR